MPARNIIKPYVENGYYHVYNRGVEKRVIFVDEQDTKVFLSYLKDYLSPKDWVTLMKTASNTILSPEEKARMGQLMRMNNFAEEIELLAYCLMPNHFHLLIKQNSFRSIEKFMRSLGTRYVKYFNQKYEGRVGGLFQGAYKGVLVKSEEQLLWLTRYIHRNPTKDSPFPSSYPNYLGLIKQGWVKPGEILKYFSKSGFNSYRSFVEDNKLDDTAMTRIGGLILEGET